MRVLRIWLLVGMQVVYQVVGMVAALAAAGWFHGDLSTNNILYKHHAVSGVEAALTDWATLARAGEKPDPRSVTGTLMFMAVRTMQGQVRKVLSLCTALSFLVLGGTNLHNTQPSVRTSCLRTVARGSLVLVHVELCATCIACHQVASHIHSAGA
jgi:hypothetical protein